MRAVFGRGKLPPDGCASSAATLHRSARRGSLRRRGHRDRLRHTLLADKCEQPVHQFGRGRRPAQQRHQQLAGRKISRNWLRYWSGDELFCCSTAANWVLSNTPLVWNAGSASIS